MDASRQAARREPLQPAFLFLRPRSASDTPDHRSGLSQGQGNSDQVVHIAFPNNTLDIEFYVLRDAVLAMSPAE